MHYNLYIWRTRSDDEVPQMLHCEAREPLQQLGDMIANMEPAYATRIEMWRDYKIVVAWGISL